MKDGQKCAVVDPTDAPQYENAGGSMANDIAQSYVQFKHDAPAEQILIMPVENLFIVQIGFSKPVQLLARRP